VVTGTAIRLAQPVSDGVPILTNVSVQDYWRLHCAGQEPVGLVASTAVVFASPPRAVRLLRARTTARNQELEELSRAFGLARETVRANLRDQASAARGSGAVGVDLSHELHREKLALASSLVGGRRGWHQGRLGMPYYVSGHSDVERRGWMITMHAAGTAVRRGAAGVGPPVKAAIRIGSG
jgi:uncharacterized protein YbjQ (UPF0145 family)